jgi:hypothetical protein
MSNETDLDLLARNVHVWPDDGLKPPFSKNQWLARRAELHGKHKVALDLPQESHEVMRRIIPQFPKDCAKRVDLLDRIEVALDSKIPDQQDQPLDMVHGADTCQRKAMSLDEAIQHAIEKSNGSGECAEQHIQLAIWLCHYQAMLEAKPQGRLITEAQEFELTTVLQSIANGFSDDPAKDAAALLKRVTGEVPLSVDSFQLPPRQGGEQVVKCPHCNAEHQDGSDAAEFIGWHGLCATCDLKGGDRAL